MRELIDSPLTLVFEDIAYQKTMFDDLNTTLIREMVQKKVLILNHSTYHPIKLCLN